MRLYSWETLKMGRFKNPDTTPIWAVKAYNLCLFFVAVLFISYCIFIAQSIIGVFIALAIVLILLGVLSCLATYIGLCELFIKEDK